MTNHPRDDHDEQIAGPVKDASGFRWLGVLTAISAILVVVACVAIGYTLAGWVK